MPTKQSCVRLSSALNIIRHAAARRVFSTPHQPQVFWAPENVPRSIIHGFKCRHRLLKSTNLAVAPGFSELSRADGYQLSSGQPTIR